MADLPPALPSQFQIYNTYLLDPPWQVKYTLVWLAASALFTLLVFPRFIRAARAGRAWQSIKGISSSSISYQPLRQCESYNTPITIPNRQRTTSRFLTTCQRFSNILLWTPPGLGLDFGQIILLVIYCFVLCFCVVFRAPLMDNPNRAGFMTIAQLPFVFFFGTKNNILGFFWQRGYDRLNFLHRWAGRGMFLSATLHGSFWIRNHLQYHVPILGLEKERLGVLTFAALGTIVLTSLKPVRKLAYQLFFFLHIGSVVVFFVLLNYHTPFSTPWIFPPLAFYGFDLLLRLLRFRVKEATLVADDNLMTLLRLEDCEDGWVAGQHVRVRAFFSGRVFESHPLTIVNAPPSTSCSPDGSALLGARVSGDWSKALNRFAQNEKKYGIPRIVVMLDGPYGGPSFDFGEYESVLLVAGGSGVTFTLAILDDLAGRIVRLGRRGNERTRRIEFAWCIRSFGNINWFAPMLQGITSLTNGSDLDLHISIYVTCLCDPQSVPRIPNSIVTMEKPSVKRMMMPLMDAGDIEKGSNKNYGDLGIAVSGPESLSTEVRNTVASIDRTTQRHGKISIHTEVFAI